jgi:hypothetical protein
MLIESQKSAAETGSVNICDDRIFPKKTGISANFGSFNAKSTRFIPSGELVQKLHWDKPSEIDYFVMK